MNFATSCAIFSTSLSASCLVLLSFSSRLTVVVGKRLDFLNIQETLTSSVNDADENMNEGTRKSKSKREEDGCLFSVCFRRHAEQRQTLTHKLLIPTETSILHLRYSSNIYPNSRKQQV
jgi:hypothetical protein